MGTTYTAKISVRCWKNHECIGCGAKFRYLFARNLQGTGSTADAARLNADKLAEQSIQSDVDLRPCPTCGRYQPDMVAKPRRIRHQWITWIAIPLAIILMVRGSAHITDFTMAISSLAAAGVLAFGAFLHLLIASGDPNSNPARNVVRAEQQMNDNFQLLTAGDLERAVASPPAKPFRSAHWVGLFMMGMAALAASSAGVLKSVSNWPDSQSYPEVVGIGEKAHVYFHRSSIDCVKSHWRGDSVQAQIVTDSGGEAAGKSIAIATQQDNWPSTISVKDGEKSTRPNLWADLTIPNEPNLVGKKLEIQAKMKIEFPTIAGDKFDVRKKDISGTFTIVPAPAGSRETYTLAFWIGSSTGIVLFLVGGFIMTRLAKSLAATALPTTVEGVGNA